ncbi:MAG: VCBS repeat-containing protein, partial [Candidatus Promineifilaceae bacterium]|nr:VCBS repeat-containing protein [Candidatus Promineifilaceae bacterium]
MTYQQILGKRSLFVLTFIFVLLALSPATGFVIAEPGGTNEVDPKWTKSLPAALCKGSNSDTNCHRSSPALADVTGDGKLEIVVATNNGHILVIRHNGEELWRVDSAPYFGLEAGKQKINSGPAVADIDADGQMEIVVGAGTTSRSTCTHGGIIVLEHTGQVKPGWPVLTQDWDIPPTGCRETIFSTPALGDLDLDGDLEIVAGGFDKRIYALHHTGQFVSGFPPNSYHFNRFGWDVLEGRLGDTIWSSAAIADLTGDGFLDVIIGSDEGNYDETWLPVLEPWHCPYSPVYTPGYCGGSVYALDRHGNLLDGFPRYILEAISSSPAIMDVNEDGTPEIFIGTGTYYYNQSPDKPTEGFRLFGFDSRGNDLPGWAGGQVVGGPVPASPAIGDITGDGQPNIVVAAGDKKLYAWHINGSMVSGFPMTPRTHFDQVLEGYDVGTGFILADYTGDGKMEIFLRHAAEIIIVSGSGHQLTAPNPNDTRPAYAMGARVWNNPAVGDLNGDGRLELVVQNSKLAVWDLPQSSTSADWPMFKRDAARTSSALPTMSVDPDEQVLLIESGDSGMQEFNVYVYGRLGTFDWQISTDRPDIVTFPVSSGTIQGQQEIQVNVRIEQGWDIGEHHLGDLYVETSSNGGDNSTELIPIYLRVVAELERSFLPF